MSQLRQQALAKAIHEVHQEVKQGVATNTVWRHLAMTAHAVY